MKEEKKEHKGMGKKEAGFGARLGKMAKGKGKMEGPHGKEMGHK
jgi:hypothetical protein